MKRKLSILNRSILRKTLLVACAGAACWDTSLFAQTTVTLPAVIRGELRQIPMQTRPSAPPAPRLTVPPRTVARAPEPAAARPIPATAQPKPSQPIPTAPAPSPERKVDARLTTATTHPDRTSTVGAEATAGCAATRAEMTVKPNLQPTNIHVETQISVRQGVVVSTVDLTPTGKLAGESVTVATPMNKGVISGTVVLSPEARVNAVSGSVPVGTAQVGPSVNLDAKGNISSGGINVIAPLK